MADPEFPEQRFAPDLRTGGGEIDILPPQMFEMPAVGWVKAEHAVGYTVAVVQHDGRPDDLMIMFYRGGRGDAAGGGHFHLFDLARARAHAATILQTCDRIEAGIDASDYPRRPPAPGARP